MKIGSRDTDERIFIIAELCNNHEGSVSLARQMVHEAAEAGADAVKFQAIDPHDFTIFEPRLSQLKSICLKWEEFKGLKAVAEDYGVEFLCTPFNVAAVEFLDPLVPAWKIAARSQGDDGLADAVLKTGKPIIQSTTKHMLGWEDEPFDLHVVSEYPCPSEHADLRSIIDMDRQGYSDHTIGIDACVGAAFLGARVIEKHFTTETAMNADNKYKSNDHVHSADQYEFKEMVSRIRKAEVLCQAG